MVLLSLKSGAGITIPSVRSRYVALHKYRIAVILALAAFTFLSGLDLAISRTADAQSFLAPARRILEMRTFGMLLLTTSLTLPFTLIGHFRRTSDTVLWAAGMLGTLGGLFLAVFLCISIGVEALQTSDGWLAVLQWGLLAFLHAVGLIASWVFYRSATHTFGP